MMLEAVREMIEFLVEAIFTERRHALSRGGVPGSRGQAIYCGKLLNTDAARPPRGYGRLTELARLVQPKLASGRYKADSDPPG
jgi:hypothetical protein